MKTYMGLETKNTFINTALHHAFEHGQGNYLAGLATLTYLAAEFYDESLSFDAAEEVAAIYDEVSSIKELPDYKELVSLYDKMFGYEIAYQHSFEKLAKTVESLDDTVILEQMNQLKELQIAEDSALGELKSML